MNGAQLSMCCDWFGNLGGDGNLPCEFSLHSHSFELKELHSRHEQRTSFSYA
jgi:hypothetical protein